MRLILIGEIMEAFINSIESMPKVRELVWCIKIFDPLCPLIETREVDIDFLSNPFIVAWAPYNREMHEEVIEQAKLQGYLI